MEDRVRDRPAARPLQVAHPLGELRPLLAELREAESLALALDDRERLGWARLHISHVLVLIDDPRPAVQLAHDVLAIAETVGNREIEADAYLWLGCGYYALGQHRRAVELLRKGCGRCGTPTSGLRDVIAQSGYVAMFLSELGEFAEAETAAETTARSAYHGGPSLEPRERVLADRLVLGSQGRPRPGGVVGRARGRAVPAVELPANPRGPLCVLGHVLALSGHATQAVDLLEQGVRQADAFGLAWLRCQRLHYLGEAYLLAGRADDARRTADQALALAREREERGFEAWALRLQAEIAAATPPIVDVAESRFREAIALATELEMRPLVAHCHLGLGKLYRRTGDGAKAEEHLTTATTMYREMDMTFWLEKAEAAIAKVG